MQLKSHIATENRGPTRFQQPEHQVATEKERAREISVAIATERKSCSKQSTRGFTKEK
jgi:hypothetical protein